MNTSVLNSEAAEKIEEFYGDISRIAGDNLHSFHVVGSVLTPDYDPKTSDINSIVVLKRMEMGFLSGMATLGRKYKKRSVSAPLIMTPEYIRKSLDVFPIEFLDFRLIHRTIAGDDILAGVEIEKRNLRLQAERELKSKLIWLRQGFISSMGDRKLLAQTLSGSITGYMPLFRAIINLFGETPPVKREEVLTRLEEITGIRTGVFRKMLLLKRKEITLSGDDLQKAFEDYYNATEEITRKVDEINI